MQATKPIKIVALLGVMIALYYGGSSTSLPSFVMSLVAPSVIMNHRLTLEVDDNGTVRKGSGVIGLAFQSEGPLRTSETSAWTVDVRGEAVAVDLGTKGILFVLLTGIPVPVGTGREQNNAVAFYFAGTFPNPIPDGLAGKRALDAFKAAKPSVNIAPANLPMLVRFGDLADPKSVARVDPNDLAASFGPGVKLLRAAIEITDDPVTTGIEKRLGWLKQVADERGTLIPKRPRLLKDATPIQLVAPSDFLTSNLWGK